VALNTVIIVMRNYNYNGVFMIATYVMSNVANRTSADEIQDEKQTLLRAPHIMQILNAFDVFAAIVDEHMQIVVANLALQNVMGEVDSSRIEGLRIGEHISCINAVAAKNGCGTSDACHTCGACKAMRAADDGRTGSEECRVNIIHNGQDSSLDLRVQSSPIHFEGQRFTIVSLTDISGEKRRRILEQIFFHDVKNTAGGIFGLTELFPSIDDEADRDEISRLVTIASKQLLDEIDTQQDLLAAENHDLVIKPTIVSARDVMDSVFTILKHHPVARERSIHIDVQGEHIVETDMTQLVRCITNLTKNALEAINDRETVTLSYTTLKDGKGRFGVHNPGAIPSDAQYQIFQRSFSTKGSGRGIGTYSVKLLVESFLKGHVHFISTNSTGTEFYIDLPLLFAKDTETDRLELIQN
jgi:signal transduction histidine kinase